MSTSALKTPESCGPFGIATWNWIRILAGLGSLALGALLVAQWPVSGLLAIGLFVTLALLIQAFFLFAVAR